MAKSEDIKFSPFLHSKVQKEFGDLFKEINALLPLIKTMDDLTPNKTIKLKGDLMVKVRHLDVQLHFALDCLNSYIEEEAKEQGLKK